MTKLLEILLRYLVKFKQVLLSHDQFRRAFQRITNANYFTDFDIHEKMLADTLRVDTYYRAISTYVRNDAVVIDLGTGTGLLSFFAHKNHPKIIYAIDHSKIIEYAGLIAERNRISDITFIRAYSKNISLPEKADVLIQEQMGSWLFNENMVECVLDLRNRLLKKGGRILPNKFAFLIEPIQLKDECRVPFIWEQEIYGINFSCLREQNQARENDTKMIHSYEVDTFLGVPAPILSFDLETLPDVTSIATTLNSHKIVTTAGRLDGFCLYFKAWFDESIFLDTSPLRQDKSLSNWRIPFYRVESVLLHKGSEVDFTLQMNDLKNPKSWNWKYQTRTVQSRQE
jgi:type I protein arginine methyltransferase